MTQSIIPGCEANPDPATVINVDPSKPMKEIPMDELKNNTDNISESFKQFLASGESVIQTCRELMEENARLRASNDRLLIEYDATSEVLLNHNIKDAAALEEILSEPVGSSEPHADYQTLKDFKGEMDAIHEEFDIPHDVDALRKELSTLREYRKEMEDRFEDSSIGKLRQVCGEYDAWSGALSDIGESITDADFIEEFPGKWEELAKLEEVASDHDITDASDLEDTLTDMEDAKAYEKGFNELAEFVEKIKEVIGHCGDDIPATNMEDYK